MAVLTVSDTARPWWLQPVDVAGLVWFRVCFGAVMVWEVCRYLAYDRVAAYYVEPDFRFTYHGFSWVTPLPGQWMYAVFAALGVLAACITVGLAYGAATVGFFFLFTYVFLLEQAVSKSCTCRWKPQSQAILR